MARLPEPGGDNDKWGDVLNTFLSVEHTADGALKIRADGTLASFYIKPGSGIPVSDFSASGQNAFALASNAVQIVNGHSATNGTVLVDKDDLGLENVDNTSDINKPISTVQQAALNTKISSNDAIAFAIAF